MVPLVRERHLLQYFHGRPTRAMKVCEVETWCRCGRWYPLGWAQRERIVEGLGGTSPAPDRKIGDPAGTPNLPVRTDPPGAYFHARAASSQGHGD